MPCSILARVHQRRNRSSRGLAIDEGLWDVYFGPIKLGRMDERLLRIADHKGRTVRKQVSPKSPD